MVAGRVTQPRRQLTQLAVRPEEHTRARWTNGLTKIFADLMVDQIRRGSRINNCFTKKAWKVMCDGFYQKTGLKWDKEQLKNRYAVMKRQHAIVKSLLSRAGFRLDEASGTIVASTYAWADYLKAHPDAEPLRSGGCPIYKQLGVIFNEPLVNGKHQQSAEEEFTAVSGKEPLKTIHVVDSSSESEEADEMRNGQGTATDNANTNRKRGRKGIDDAIAGAILHMAEASKLGTAAINQINARYSIADCIKELDNMKGIEQDIYFAALDLFNKPIAREIFLSLVGDKRLIWLLSKCNAKHN